MKNQVHLEQLEVPQYHGMASSNHVNQSNHQENQHYNNMENSSEDDTKEFFVYDEEDKKIKNCMIGKFLSDKPLHKLPLNQALSNMWCNPKELKVTELQQQFLQITMENNDDFKRYQRQSVDSKKLLVGAVGIAFSNPDKGYGKEVRGQNRESGGI
ncbi:hypothetical protein L195_g048325 [Trifolium pratense]|uniref:Uncharacterized protein n=1 Tax=Trifolium pratense TaxID=57577 RepID=A0A2K3JL10_TRIPR|nr:hypothetical protein L195_g048325 [Trifolium pratense]